MYHKLRFIYKYERKTSVLTSEVSSRSTLDVGIMDFYNGLLAAKQIVKLWPEKGFEWRQTSFPCFQIQNPFFAIFFACQGKLLDFFFDIEYKIVASSLTIFFFKFFILCYSDIVLFYNYISDRLHGLFNAFFSAFYSKQLNKMIYFYLYVFGWNNSNPSFYEKQLLAIAACSGFGWMFPTHRQEVYN